MSVETHSLLTNIHIENNAMKKEVSAAKECIEMLQDMQNTLT